MADEREEIARRLADMADFLGGGGEDTGGVLIAGSVAKEHAADLRAILARAQGPGTEAAEEISSKTLPGNGLGWFERAEEISLCAAWLYECARYFERRPTNGEDAAHWSNVANAENARKYAALICSLIDTPDGGEAVHLPAEREGSRDEPKNVLAHPQKGGEG
ncbi:MAG: hypothetical protein LCH78_17910 [Proteobacteria bacterium]|nr:hypothetical protein [Pseudomonadota bacterium]